MKPCDYCGRENDDAATHCRECATSFDKETPGTSVDFRRTLQSPVGLAVTSGLAALLISTGVYCAVGRYSLHLYHIHHPDSIFTPPNGHDAIIMYKSVERILMLGFAVFTFAVCFMRCQKRWKAFVVAVITLGILALPRFLPGSLSVVPAFVIGISMNSSTGFYIGSALQIGIGAWLLGWFSRRKIQDEIHAA
jgi:hypothetical protein